MSNRVVKLTIITDFICVNCCLGQLELLDAITHCKSSLNLPLSFEIELVPFRLIGPDVLRDDVPIDRATFYKGVMGKEEFSNLQLAVSKYSEEKGISISFRGCMSQTTRAHRLCQKAYALGGQKLQIPLMSAIFKAHMEDARDIADIDVLAELAESTGAMNRTEAIKFLESDELEKEVEEMSDTARSKGISGVPMIIINGKWAVSGSQSSDVFVQIFKKLASTNAPASPPTLPLMEASCA